MNKKIPFLLAVLLLALPTAAQITVAAAANMQFAMDEIKAAYKAETGKEIKAVYGASGKLTTQIKNGAPFDLFVSADMSYPDSLFKWKYAVEKPRIYAYGILVLWTVKDYDLSQGSAILTDPSIVKIAVGDLKATIYGPAAVKAMTKAGVYDSVKSKLVFGENIAQVAQYITTQAADIGFNAKSIVLSPQMKDKGKWVEVDKSLYDPMAQGAVILQYGKDNNPKACRDFHDYFFGKKASLILEKYGYILPEQPK